MRNNDIEDKTKQNKTKQNKTTTTTTKIRKAENHKNAKTF